MPHLNDVLLWSVLLVCIYMVLVALNVKATKYVMLVSIVVLWLVMKKMPELKS